MEKYINVYDLVFNGAEGCELLDSRPINAPFLVASVDPSACAGRGLATISYKGEVVTSQMGGRDPEDEAYISVGMCHIALKWVMANLYRCNFA